MLRHHPLHLDASPLEIMEPFPGREPRVSIQILGAPSIHPLKFPLSRLDAVGALKNPKKKKKNIALYGPDSSGI